MSLINLSLLFGYITYWIWLWLLFSLLLFFLDGVTVLLTLTACNSTMVLPRPKVNNRTPSKSCQLKAAIRKLLWWLDLPKITFVTCLFELKVIHSNVCYSKFVSLHMHDFSCCRRYTASDLFFLICCVQYINDTSTVCYNSFFIECCNHQSCWKYKHNEM